MSTFVVEHKYKGNYVMETIAGVEDIDTSIYKNLLGIWVCDSPEEVKAVETELRRIRHARSSQQT
jgi:hypothetical protein